MDRFALKRRAFSAMESGVRFPGFKMWCFIAFDGNEISRCGDTKKDGWSADLADWLVRC